ncbi:MAG: hypothetical protein QOK28_1345 [Actinomycetota bacterium]
MTEALIEVVSSHHERAVVRFGDVFVKSDTDPARAEREAAALRSVAAVPVPEVLWYRPGQPSLLAISAVTGRHISSDEDWGVVGAALARLHSSRVPSDDEIARARGEAAQTPGYLREYASWFRDHEVGDLGLVERLTGEAAEFFATNVGSVAFIHGDLQPDHVFLDGGAVSGIIDWADCGYGDPVQDLAVVTVDHPEGLDALIEGYGQRVDRHSVWAHWVLRRFGAIRWLNDYGFPIDASLAALPALDESVR